MECAHVPTIQPVQPRAAGCEECEREGKRWAQLRLCLTCGHVGCDDTSVGRHATRHFEETGHPLNRSLKPGDRWGWCYVHRVKVDIPPRALESGAIPPSIH